MADLHVILGGLAELLDQPLRFEHQPWLRDAACRGAGPADFFPTQNGNAASKVALAMCEVCPVRKECLDANINEPWGIFGGTTERQRRIMRREARTALGKKRGTGRPAVAQCGTTAGFHRHRRHGETVCLACSWAKRVYDLERAIRAREAL